jgi:hypothetical protein
VRTVESSQNQRLGPEVVRSQPLKSLRLLGFDPRSPLHQLPVDYALPDPASRVSTMSPRFVWPAQRLPRWSNSRIASFGGGRTQVHVPLRRGEIGVSCQFLNRACRRALHREMQTEGMTQHMNARLRQPRSCARRCRARPASARWDCTGVSTSCQRRACPRCPGVAPAVRGRALSQPEEPVIE